ncbi:MAG TPA: hypothetical protein VK049_04190 [Paenalcaligenes sp.]|nr:hypothetical protein [Paenalcaligenes sp.]
MIDCNLAASANTTFAQASSARQLVDVKWRWIPNVLRVIEKIDRRAGKFFTAQAVTRGRQPAKTEWGMQLEEGFL